MAGLCAFQRRTLALARQACALAPLPEAARKRPRCCQKPEVRPAPAAPPRACLPRRLGGAAVMGCHP